MFFKRKCPFCGAKNAKAHITCGNCGAVFEPQQGKRRISDEKIRVAPRFSTTVGQQREPTNKELIAWYGRQQKEAEEQWRRHQKELSSMRNRDGVFKMYKGLLGTSLFALASLAFIVFLLWQVISPRGEGWSWGFLLYILVFSGLTFFLLSRARNYVKDIRVGQTQMVGKVSRKWEDRTANPAGPGKPVSTVDITYCMEVEGVRFEVPKEVYGWLRPGHDVRVHYWTSTKIVSRVYRVGGREETG